MSETTAVEDISSESVPEPFTDTDNGLLSGQIDSVSLEDEDNQELEEGMSLGNDHLCGICEERFKQPRILACLHTFCTECLQGKVAPLVTPASAQEALTQALAPLCPGTITCPTCNHVTRLGPRGVTDLAIDYVLINILDMADIEEQQIICTSCKAQEKAVARCSDCANFLCPNCVTAHQFMRCFENHKVVSFDELRGKEGVSIHKPIFCSFHDSENVKYFCNSCQIPICNECMLGEHRQPDHSYERIADLGERQTEELKNLIFEAKKKVTQCEEASTSLEGHLSELQMQRDNARGLVNETFQSYKAVLEKQKDKILQELESIHTTQELHIMDLFENVGKTIERIEDSCKFTERVIQHGNSVEILLVKKVVQEQIMALINNTPKPDVNVKINFVSDASEFEKAIGNTFGSFGQDKKAEIKKDTQEQSLHSSFDGEAFSIPGNILGDAANLITPVSVADLIPAIANLPPLSLTNLSTGVGVDVVDTAAMGAVDVDPTNDISCARVGSGVDLAGITGTPGDMPSGASSAATADIAGVSAHTINNIASSLQNLPLVGANTNVSLSGVSQQIERSSSRNSYSPAMSDSGISVDAASTSSGQGTGHVVSTSFGAGSAFSKQGLTVNAAGNVMMNGQMIPGLNINSMTRGTTPTTPAAEQSLASIYGSIAPPTGSSGSSGTPGNASRSQTPQQLADLANLLSQTSPNAPNSLTGLSTQHAITGGASGMMSPQAGMLPPTTPTRVNLNLGAPPLPGPSSRNVTKMSAMQIRCKFGQLGPGKGQFNSPHGFCLGMDEDIVVADTNNHRIQVFEKTGEFKYQFGIPGREEGQLWYPRKVAVMRNSGKYVVCDRGNERSRMQIFTKNGHFMKKISIRYIDIVAGLAITQQGHIVAVDSVSPTVFCIAETGELIKWFDCSDYMREPSDIAISGKEYFVCDFKGHCVVVFNEDGQFIRRIGCENITNYPNGIDISDAGDVLIGDSHGNRFHVAVFQREGSLIGEFECPYVKVSRCCGLKITLEGYVVTLAKNNHHVLVLNTLYIA